MYRRIGWYSILQSTVPNCCPPLEEGSGGRWWSPCRYASGRGGAQIPVWTETGGILVQLQCDAPASLHLWAGGVVPWTHVPSTRGTTWTNSKVGNGAIVGLFEYRENRGKEKNNHWSRGESRKCVPKGCVWRTGRGHRLVLCGERSVVSSTVSARETRTGPSEKRSTVLFRAWQGGKFFRGSP